MPQIRRNLYTVIIAVDPSKTSSIATINLATSIIQRGYPIRFGIVPIVENEEGPYSPPPSSFHLASVTDTPHPAGQIAQILYYLSKTFEPLQAIGLYMRAAVPGKPSISPASLRTMYEGITATETPADGSETWKSFEELVDGYDDVLDRLGKYLERLALKEGGKGGKGGHAFVNGKYLALSDVSYAYPLVICGTLC